jgi:hypothetical protein
MQVMFGRACCKYNIKILCKEMKDIMRPLKNIINATVVIALLVGLGGCASSLIGSHQGADRVLLVEASQARSCVSKGETTVSVLSRILFFNRSADAVEANLLQMARNDAVDSGADTLVKGDSQKFGERTFGLYKCRP